MPSNLLSRIFAHGLFERPQHHERVVIGSLNEWEEVCLDIGGDWKDRLFNYDGFFACWRESAVWLLRDAGLWDEGCKQRLTEFMEPKKNFNALLMMSFGRRYFVDRSGVEILMDWKVFVERVGSLGNDLNGEDVTDDIRAAYGKALDRFGTIMAQ